MRSQPTTHRYDATRPYLAHRGRKVLSWNILSWNETADGRRQEASSVQRIPRTLRPTTGMTGATGASSSNSDRASDLGVLTSSPAGTDDWSRRGTRKAASAAMQQTGPGAVVNLPRRGERSPYQTVADNAMQTPSDRLRRGSR